MFNFSKSNLSKICAMAFLGLGAIGCNNVDPSTVTPAAVKGSADFTKYVAVGNSLTAGFADNGLYNTGIMNSYPSMLALQFSKVGGGVFVQPLFSAGASEGFGSDGGGYRRIVGRLSAPQLFSRTVCPTMKSAIVGVNGMQPILEEFAGANNVGGINNLGVPGIRMNDIKNPNYGLPNPLGFNQFFERLLPGSSAISYQDYVSSKVADATFFTCWLGNNDVLGYAASGATTAGPQLSDVATFTTNFNDMINKLTENGRKGLVATIPSVTNAPFFGKRGVGAFAAIPATQVFVIETSTGPRAITDNDFLLIGASAEYGRLGRTDYGAGQPAAYGSLTNPLVDAAILDASEVEEVMQRTTEFNNIMVAKANEKGLAVFVSNDLLALVNSPAGFASNGITYRATYLQGGAFSADGIHLTPAGYALTANEMIKAINAKYGSTIPLLNTSNYSTIRIWETLCQ